MTATARRHKTSWRPLRVHAYDDRIRATASTIYGYRGECSCGWLSQVRRTVHEVRALIRDHHEAAHG